MTDDRRFSVRGKRVVVVGAARSGVAAAELLVRRGAHGHAHRPARAIADEARGCATAGVALELGGHRAADVHRAPI